MSEVQHRTDPSSSSQQFQGYNQYETDDQYLQDLAYKAKFAEEISNNMRVPKQITMDDDDDEFVDSVLPGSYNNNAVTEMKVPNKIVLSRLDSENENLKPTTQNAFGVSPDETMNSSAEMTPKKQLTLNLENDDTSFAAQNSRQIELKTPPRVLGVLDRIETGDTPNINAEQLNKILFLNRQLSVNQAADEAMKNSQSIDLDVLNDLLPLEDNTSAIIRQQLQQMHRRIITLEKRDAERLKSEKFNQTVLYATCGLAGIALIVAAMARKSASIPYY